MEEGRGVHKVLVEKPEGKNHWGDQDVDERIILRWIFRKREEVVGTGWNWLRIGTDTTINIKHDQHTSELQ